MNHADTFRVLQNAGCPCQSVEDIVFRADSSRDVKFHASPPPPPASRIRIVRHSFPFLFVLFTLYFIYSHFAFFLPFIFYFFAGRDMLYRKRAERRYFCLVYHVFFFVQNSRVMLGSTPIGYPMKQNNKTAESTGAVRMAIFHSPPESTE